MIDPDPRVSGNGLSSVKRSGADVKLIRGVESMMCQEINAPFVFRVLNGRPHCTLWGGYTAAIDYVKNCAEVFRPDSWQSSKEAESARRFVRSAFVDIEAVAITRGTLLNMALYGRLGLFYLLPTTACIVVVDDSRGSRIDKLDIEMERVINATRKLGDSDVVLAAEWRRWFVETLKPQEAAKHIYSQDSRLPSVTLLFSSASRGELESTHDDYVRRCLLLMRNCNLSCNSLLLLTDDIADLMRLTEAGLVQRLYLSYRSEYDHDETQSDVSKSSSMCANGWDDWLNTDGMEAALYCRAKVNEAQALQIDVIRRLAELLPKSDKSTTACDHMFRSTCDHLMRVCLSSADKDESTAKQNSSKVSPYGLNRSLRAGLGGSATLSMYRTSLWIPTQPSV